MGRTGFRLEGDDAFDAQLEGVAGFTDPEMLRRVGFEALEPVADAARGLVRRRSGRLQRSLGVGDRLSPAQAVKHSPEPGTIEVYVGPGSMPQAITEEFGTVHEAGHPYLRPAWDGNVDTVLSRVADGLRSAFRRGARG